jgi:hypothetical protein
MPIARSPQRAGKHVGLEWGRLRVEPDQTVWNSRKSDLLQDIS